MTTIRGRVPVSGGARRAHLREARRESLWFWPAVAAIAAALVAAGMLSVLVYPIIGMRRLQRETAGDTSGGVAEPHEGRAVTRVGLISESCVFVSWRRCTYGESLGTKEVAPCC